MTPEEEIALLRKQLRNAWAKLDCRCIFNDQDEMTHQDDHCPYHGTYQLDPDNWWPLADLRNQLAELQGSTPLWIRVEDYDKVRGELQAAVARAEAAETAYAQAREVNRISGEALDQAEGERKTAEARLETAEQEARELLKENK